MLNLLKIKALRVVVLLLLGVFAHALPAAAQVTSLSMTTTGDYIGQGQTYLYTPADGAFNAQVADDNGVRFFFNTSTFSHWWGLELRRRQRCSVDAGQLFQRGAVSISRRSRTVSLRRWARLQ